MPLLDLYRAARDHTRDQRTALQANQAKLGHRLADVFLRTWDLGFTAFGGPPVHFQIIHRRFVEGRGGKAPWIDEQTYQELFAICQGLPGPGSTKMLFCVVLIHAGFLPALFVFLTWSLPGAVGMYALSRGVQRIDEILPSPVYALLSGLNASTVGIIALAAVQLADKAIKDKLTRVLVIFGACAGLCYNALWFFPVLMLIGGAVAVVWDLWMRRWVRDLRRKVGRSRGAEGDDAAGVEGAEGPLREDQKPDGVALQPVDLAGRERARVSVPPTAAAAEAAAVLHRRSNSSQYSNARSHLDEVGVSSSEEGRRRQVGSSPVTSEEKESGTSPAPEVDTSTHGIPIRVGVTIIIVFFLTFIAVLVARGVLNPPPLALDLFASMYLAGTIIFGGGPVVIPLLREYVVEPGWVLARDFLLGLAIIQAFPGPNFNFAVYLGGLAIHASSSSSSSSSSSTSTSTSISTSASPPSRLPTLVGSLLGYVGIFVPGVALAVGVQSVWRILRRRSSVASALRGVNATAVGLVFTAVYRLWEIGFLDRGAVAGQSLGREPWWVVVAALTYAESAWFGVPPAPAIVLGAVLGVGWWGAVGRG